MLKRLLDDFSGCYVNHNSFCEANWKWASFQQQKNYIIYVFWFRELYCQWKRWRWRWFSCAKDDPEFSWQRCSSLISCLTKWPFSLHSDIMESHIVQLIFILGVAWAPCGQNTTEILSCFVFLKSSSSGESRRFFFATSLLESPVFFPFPSTDWARTHIYLPSVMQWKQAWWQAGGRHPVNLRLPICDNCWVTAAPGLWTPPHFH